MCTVLFFCRVVVNTYQGTTEPTDDGDETNTNDKGKVVLVGKQDTGDEHTKNSHPGSGTGHGGFGIVTSVGSSWNTVESTIVEACFIKGNQGNSVFFGASSQGNGGRNVTDDNSNTFGRLEAKVGQKGTNGSGSGMADRLGNELGDKVTNSGQGQEQKDETFNEHGGHGRFKTNLSSSVETDDTETKRDQTEDNGEQ